MPSFDRKRGLVSGISTSTHTFGGLCRCTNQGASWTLNHLDTIMKLPLLLQRFAFAALLACCAHAATAQCTYRLDMFDLAEDGWDGGSLTITSGPNTYNFELNPMFDDGADSTVFFQVLPNVPLILEWQEGFFDEEVSMTMYNSDGVEIFSDDNPNPGEIYNQNGICPPCATISGFFYENIYDNRVKIRWSPGISTAVASSWTVIYGPGTFTPGPGLGDTLVVSQPRATITGLVPNTEYTIYVVQNCSDGTGSILSGPYTFTTYYSNDVAVTDLVTPQSSCDLGVEIIRFAMTNFGSNPQSLIPYTFFVNGDPGGVTQPEDGYFTGVIGKDSTEIIEFETTYDFSEPGEYEIIVVTQMEGDDNPANDTLVYYINNILTAPYAQTFEGWGGGWKGVAAPSSASTWQWGVPAAPIINAAGEGDKAWVTNLTGPTAQFEESFLESTCFDFSELTIDPAVRFLYNTQLDDFAGALTLESTINDGISWQVVGTTGEGLNWYNNGFIDEWVGSTDGWLPAQHRLNGLAGESNVRFRFVFSSGFSFIPTEGVGIDDFSVFVPASKDLAVTAISTLGDDVTCGLAQDAITVTVVNLGAQAIAPPIQLFYSINGGSPIAQTFTGNIVTSDENYTVTFTVPFDSRDALNSIKVWHGVSGDLNALNDTLTYSIDHRPLPVPFRENFEGSTNIPEGWNIVEGNVVEVTNLHNNISNVLAINIYASNPTSIYELPRYGLIDADDTLRFDYRLTIWSAGIIPLVLSNGTKIETFISTNCGQTFTLVNTINSSNHLPTASLRTRKIPLTAFAGQSITIRIVATWGAGDFWFDLDNVGIIACNTTMGLSADVVNTQPGTTNGRATVQVGLGNPPYTYSWSTGATTQTIEGLGIATYTVSVSDSNGCSDVLEVNIGNVSTDNLPGLSQWAVRPNPSNGMLFMDIQFEQAVELRAEVINLLGQTVWAAQPGFTTGLSEAIDLTRQPPGMYLLRVIADGQVATKKIIRN
jgi:Secretion system C-terminal sorting domain